MFCVCVCVWFSYQKTLLICDFIPYFTWKVVYIHNEDASRIVSLISGVPFIVSVIIMILLSIFEFTVEQ